MIEIIGLIALLVVSFVVFCCWAFLQKYCLTAIEYLSKHPKSDFIIHMFTGLGSGWLIILWTPKTLVFILGVVLLAVAAIMRYAIPTEQLPEKLKSSGMGGGLPIGLALAWLAFPWIPKILALILGVVSIVGAETMHYVFPNLVAKAAGSNEKT